jgi:hypothetical protein
METFVERALNVLVKLPCVFGLMALGFILETLVDLPFRIAMHIDGWGRSAGRRRGL